ncbi:S8 family serine peptidase [Imhoffiella purpurea]|uniref:S8 family serine peptidase n=1 Tax=Imhoffiella purpurea TaxID=1249627 RepID=UPI0006936850|nr:S8 family serine peptidase [Imhoffiella purpurea]
MSDFIDGESETGVIVTLAATAAADDLAAVSSAGGPEGGTQSDDIATYRLSDLDVREQLRETVTDEVETVIQQLDPTQIEVTQQFSYQFGFAARVTLDGLVELAAHPSVIRIEKDAILEAHLQQGIPLMNGTTARSSYDGSGMSIAICDTGIDTSHPMLGGGGSPFNSKVIGGYDTGDNDPDPRPDSISGNAHGTACAGIAAGTLGTSGDYIGGVAPGAKLYAIKISTGNTGSATTSAMIAGWEWAITHQNDNPSYPIMVISTSFGGGQSFSTCDSNVPSMTTAAANAVSAGITLFVSSGNDGYCSSMGWPACISHVNSVGAVYDASFGTYGFCLDPSYTCASTVSDYRCPSPTQMAWDSSAADKVTVYSNSASFLTMFAPSHNAYTPDIVGVGGSSTDDYNSSFGGTSAACPYAAGAAAVLQSAAKAKTGSYLTPAQVQQYLVNYGDSVTDSKVAINKPRVNLGNAVDALPSSVTPSGQAEIVWRNASTGAVDVWQMTNGAISGATNTAPATGLGWSIVATNDFNKDGSIDVFWQYPATGATWIWLMSSGAIGTSAARPSVSDTNWKVVDTGDFNNDGTADLLWRHATTGENYVWLMHGGSLAAALPISTVSDLNWSIAGTGDFNADGTDDILWRNASTGQNDIWLMQGGYPAMYLNITPVTNLTWTIAGTGDFNADGSSDILWRNTSTGQNDLWLMQGGYPASYLSITTVSNLNWTVAGTGDLNNDNATDIVWRNTSTGQNDIWLMYDGAPAAFLSTSTVSDLNWEIMGISE